jgi:hypothetical protein
MLNKGKYIGISNRIPFVVLEHAINDFIKTGVVNTQDYLEYIKEFTAGDNRAKKTLGALVSIINKNSSLLAKLSIKLKRDFRSLPQNDRNTVLICLHALAFPITYDILVSFAQGFKVQELISKRVILEKISSSYGSNRAMHIGVDETIPFLISVGTIEREKIGIYKKALNKLLTSDLTFELLVYTEIKLSGSKSLLIDDLAFKPWFSYFNIKSITEYTFKFLIAKKESLLGNGYLSLVH